MSEWKSVKLGDFCDLIAGFAFKASDFGVYPQKVIKIGDITPPSVSISTMVGVDMSKYDLKKLSKYKVTYDDFVLAMTGATIGKIGRYTGSDSVYINQRVLLFKPKDSVDPKFIYYALASSRFQSYIINHIDSESAQPNISAGTIGKYKFDLPSDIIVQHRIAAILSSLDAQIENNNRINRNLEEQAQALFKSWFVDFEPWGGVMPEGWKEGKYIDIIEKTVSGDWGKENTDGNYTHEVACVRGCDFEDIKNGMRGKTPRRYILEKNYQSKHLNPQDVLVEISGGTATVSTGRACLVSKELLDQYKNNIVCTNFCKVVRPRVGFSAYLFYSWLYKYKCKVMFGYENGTSGIKNFAIADFIEKEPVLLPTIEDIAKFQEIIDVLHATIQKNGVQSARLAALRDTMLPKLMKGEIEI